MRKYHIYLPYEEHLQVIKSLVSLKNDLINQGKYTDGVDDVLFKMLNSKKKKVKIK